MAYVWILGRCFACGNVFQFNAEKVPSLSVSGVREPICSRCVPIINEERAKLGNELIVPLPGAYEPERIE
jgi:hypothetical protein